MANFDTNHWYQLTVRGHSTNSMVGTVLYDAGRGAAFMKATNTSDPDELWQLFPFNSSYYVLRTKESGAQSYLNTANSTTETTPGNTVPNMTNSTLSDSSMFWQISPWEDGTFYLTNAANGTAWHLNAKPNGLMSMSSNITTPQVGQSFSFTQLGTIDNVKYSSVITPSAAAIPTKTSSANPSSTQSSSAASSKSSEATKTLISDTSPTSTSTFSPTSTVTKGLSTGASAAIGASVGVAIIVVACIIGFILYRRRKGFSKVAQSLHSNEDLKDLAKENPVDHLSIYGIGGRGVVELVGQYPAIELQAQSTAASER